MTKILVLNGPNLNMLGSREPGIYGAASLEQIYQRLEKIAQTDGVNLVFFQSNSEAELIEKIHSSQNDNTDFLIFNPAAFTHTSVALRDAILAVDIPFIELHISNVYKREAFRQRSFFSDIALGVICGLGPYGYEAALCAAIRHLNSGD